MPNQFNEINLCLPKNLRFLHIDVAQRSNPIFPPNEEYSFYVLIMEPQLKNASTFLEVSPRLRVLPCALGSSYSISTQQKEGENTATLGIDPSKRVKLATQMTALVPKVSLEKIVSAVPETAEIFLRTNWNNLTLTEAKESSEALKRVTIVKKRLLKESDSNDEMNKEKWFEFMESLGFQLAKIDILQNGYELVWVNPKPKFPSGTTGTFLFENQKDQNTIKIKNYVKINFRTFFFGTDRVSVLNSSKGFDQISLEDGSWKLAEPNSDSFPENAFAVSSSTDENESSTIFYLTHSFFKGGLHCGHAEKTNPREAAFCWSRYQLTGNSFQVLCGENFQWSRLDGMNIPLNAVVGGRENNGEELFIAKVVEDEKIYIGKICATWMIVEGNVKSLKCQYYNEKTVFSEDFEVLVYSK